VRLGRDVHHDVGLFDERIDERRIPHVTVPELNA
jgi:hypothetical protein